MIRTVALAYWLLLLADHQETIAACISSTQHNAYGPLLGGEEEAHNQNCGTCLLAVVARYSPGDDCSMH